MTSSRARELGYTPSRIATELRHGRWQRLAAGVLLTRPDAPQRSDWIYTGVALGGPGSTLTGWDALRLHDLGDPEPAHGHVLILTRGGKNRQVGDVRLRPSRRPVKTVWTKLSSSMPTLAVAPPARAIADTAPSFSRLQPVRALVLSAVQRQLCTYEQLVAELEAAPQNGSALLRRAVADVAGGAQSVAEAEAFDLLRSAELPRFHGNAPIVDAAGRLVAVADALWPHLRAVLEVDSREFHFSEMDWKRTMARHNELTTLGYAVAHYPPSAIRTGQQAWVDEVRTWLVARAEELGVPLFPR